MAALDARSPVPLYQQLAELLEGRIAAGAYPAGSRIPSEPELSRRFGIGRPTVRQATEVLVRRRCLERRRGAGTFVVEPPPAVDLLSLAGTMASFERTGLDVRTRILRRPRRGAVAEDPENPFAGREAWTLARLSCLDGTPVLLECMWLDPDRFPALDRSALAGRSISQLAAEHYDLTVESADQSFRVAAASGEAAEALELAEGAALLLVKRRIHFSQARDAVFAELHCRTDRLVFSQTLGGPDHG